MSARSISSLLLLPGLAFEGLVRVRNSLYTRGVLRQRRLGRPVISVGNLSLGGSGKTPLVIYLGQLLQELGAVPALLSRGYGRVWSSFTCAIPPGGALPSFHLAIGDEPVLIRRYVPQVWLGISPNRYAAGRLVLKNCPSAVFIMDDGFQHRRLHRDLDIVVLDRSQSLETERVIPRGRLREPLTGLRRANLVMINGSRLGANSDPLEETVKKINPEAKIFYCNQRITEIVPWEHWRGARADGITVHECGPAFLITAIGNPRRFQNDVRGLGIHVAGVRFFRDHHILTARDWQKCIVQASNSGAEVLIITEKDAVKLDRPPEYPLLVAVQATEVEPSDEFTRIVRRVTEGTLMEVPQSSIGNSAPSRSRL